MSNTATNFGLIFLLALLIHFQPCCYGQSFEEYKEPAGKLKNFIETMVTPLHTVICEGIDEKHREEIFRKQLCGSVYTLQRDYEYMANELPRQKDKERQIGLFMMTFSTIKDTVSTHSYRSNKDKLSEMLKGKISRQFVEALELEIEGLCHSVTSDHYNLAKLRFKKAVDELKLLQFQGDFSSERARELAYECVYIGRVMAKAFIAIDDRIGGLHWALQQFPVDLLAYKMEIPELRDIHIEWDQQDGIRTVGLVPGAVGIKGYERAKAMLDHFTKTLLYPIEAYFQKIIKPTPMEEMLNKAGSLLRNYPIKELNYGLAKLEMQEQKKVKGKEIDAKVEKSRWIICEGMGKDKGKDKRKDKGKIVINIENTSAEEAENNTVNFTRIALMAKNYQKIKDSVLMNTEDRLLQSLPKHFQLSDEFCYKIQEIGTSHQGKEGIKQIVMNHFKDNLRKFNGIHFASMDVRQLAYECIHSCMNIEKYHKSPVEQLNWALQQFTVNLMVFSMEIPWVRELPVQNMNALIEHTKAIQLLEKFHGQILVKLREKCREIGHNPDYRPNKFIFPKPKADVQSVKENMCWSVMKMQENVDQMEKGLKEAHSDGGVRIMEETALEIKNKIFLFDTTFLWEHLGAQIPQESEAIKVEVDKFRDEMASGANDFELEQRFEASLIKFRKMQTTGDFSSPQAKEVAFDCVYTGHWMVFGSEWNDKRENPFEEMVAIIRQFAVDLLVYRMEIAEIRAIPDILMWTHGIA